MTLDDIKGATAALLAWFDSQGIEDRYAAVVMASALGYQLSINFKEEDRAYMAAAFKTLLDKSISKYNEGKKNEAQRPD